jgi:hypothetical protein
MYMNININLFPCQLSARPMGLLLNFELNPFFYESGTHTGKNTEKYQNSGKHQTTCTLVIADLPCSMFVER